MDNFDSPTPQPVTPANPGTQDTSIVKPTSQSTPQFQPLVNSPVVAQTPQLPKKSGLKKSLLIVFSIIGAVILIGGIGFFILIVSVFHSLNSQCGFNSDTHKQEVPKLAVLNKISVLPVQSNGPASIYDSSNGTCNLDVAQSYSATKSYMVNMNGMTALSTVTNSMKKQGFTLTKQVFSYGGAAGQSSCSTSIWGWANFTGKSTIITVVFGSPTQQCSSPPGTYLLGALPTVTQAQFSSAPVTSIKATVSTPDNEL